MQATKPTTTAYQPLTRHFTKGPYNYEDITWKKFDAKISDPSDGSVVFEMKDIEAPDFWSQTAVDIVSSKYFRKAGVDEAVGGTAGGAETRVRQLIDRVVTAIGIQGRQQGHFASFQEMELFADELRYLLIHQYAAFNSPVWFNAGLREAYGITGNPAGSWAVDKQGEASLTPDSYTRPQISACFILGVEDSLEAIGKNLVTEQLIFKMGGGAGSNFSKIRAANEPLAGGGKSSGLMSFLEVYDKSAGAIKSGGTTRRAAKIAVLNADHPDIEAFIEWKVREEKKVAALVAAGYSKDFNGEAYRTVSGQNANNSVRVTDDFMHAVVDNKEWNTTWRTNGKVAKTYKAKDLMRKIATAAWKCADPGLQFDTTTNHWNPVKNSGRIEASNPCQPAFATVLTPTGIRPLGQVLIGDTIWSGKQWTKVTAKWSIGQKEVLAYKTRAGVFYGTENHKVVQNKEKVEAKLAETIDTSQGPAGISTIDPQDIVDGLMIGDGTVHKASNNLAYLLVGVKDTDYLKSEILPFFVEERPGIGNHASEGSIQNWIMKTTISSEDLPKTFERAIPNRFRFGGEGKVRGFLRGLYTANGSVVADRVTLKASSFKVIEAVQEMLSSIGIRSYYTVNASHDVEFSNGAYTCKESYDLNITSDRGVFAEKIGFLQNYKTEKLQKVISAKKAGRSKTSYEIVEIEPLGVMEVFDLTVDAPEHTYWTGGLLVSNCSEFFFLPDTACNLLSLNLCRFLDASSYFDTYAFRQAVDVCITAQEILVDYASYPTKEIAENSHNFRPLGMGFTNLGALLMRLGIPYDSPAGRDLAAAITASMTGAAYRRSAEIAKKLGAFKAFEKNRDCFMEVMEAHNQARLENTNRSSGSSHIWAAAQADWEAVCSSGQTGFRNAQISLQAPTGTISFMMDCDTTGIEPDYSLVKYKKLAGGGSLKIVNQSVDTALTHLGYHEVERKEILRYLQEHDTLEGSAVAERHLPIFDCATKCGKLGKRFIRPRAHLEMMSAMQPFLSGSQSKTVNCPEETTVEEIEKLYIDAWKLGLKSIAIYRDNSKLCAVLSSKEETKKTVAVVPATATLVPTRQRLPFRRHGPTQEARVGGCKIFLRAGEYPDGKIGEIFIDMHKEGATTRSLLNAFSIAVSLGLQYGVPLDEFVDAFVGMKFDPKGVVRHDDKLKMVSSVLDYVFRNLGIHYLGRKDLAAKDKRDQSSAAEEKVLEEVAKAEAATTPKTDGHTCTACGNLTVKSGACYVCSTCGTTTGCG